ncbi:MAG: di-trans,poly-cis-decaprenylcistransferase [Opitutales bacterium]|nr:di-trans,poly-cis-decaprenylcistransferase [Opitutales bacterium]
MPEKNSASVNPGAAHSEAPRHVAIIMDGNGRWAKGRGLPRIMGHREGARRVLDVFEAAAKKGVEFLTLYAFSSENWSRPKSEVNSLMKLLMSSLKKYGKMFLKNEVRFRTIGDISALPENCRAEIERLKESTRRFTKANLVLALNYGSRGELVRAANKIGKASGITWEDIKKNLDTAEIPDPDIIIRTSGEMRLSNFLLLQAAYSELYFTSVNWPDFDAKEFEKAMREYAKRERRYGLTTEQLKTND